MQNIRNGLRLTPTTDIKLWKQLVFFLLGFIGLTVTSLLLEVAVVLYGKSAYPNPYDYSIFISSTGVNMFMNGAAYLIVFVVFICLIQGDVEEFLKSFKGWKPYVAAAIGFSAILVFNITYNSILNILNVSISDNANESSLNTMVTDFPFTSIVIFALVGPVVEELTYRVGLFSLLKRVHISLAYIVTIIVFTLIHFDFTTSNLTNELLNIPFYAFAAGTFCFLYHRYGLASSAAAHITNNLFSVLATIISNFK